ncbi:MAG: DUF3841 domain-containing protein [Dorea sp.]
MGNTNHTVKLYASQADAVLHAIERDGVCYSKAEYVRRKYQESAPIFLTAYSWFVNQMGKYVEKPEQAEYPYWAFMDLYSVDQSGESNVLELEVPIEEVVFFDMMDWNKIMRLSYIGETKAEEEDFRFELEQRGLDGNKVMLSTFYPEFKQQIMKSWERLFRHHEAIKVGDTDGVHSVQAGLWRIKKEWIVKRSKE